jgi:hypothetical protein
MTIPQVRRVLALIVGMTAVAQTPPDQSESPCVAQPSVWKQATEFRHVLCAPGVDVEISPKPVYTSPHTSSPIAYMVAIHNHSAARIRTDPRQWHLLWTEKKGTPREAPSLNARQVGAYRPIEPSTWLFAGQSAAGFVYFKKPKSKDATIAVVFEPDQGSPLAVPLAVSGNPSGTPAMMENRFTHRQDTTQ